MSEKFHIKHDSGTRLIATVGDYQVVTGKGDPGSGQDGMSPGQLFTTSLGACIAVTLLAYCKNHGIAYQGMEVDMEREQTEDGRRLKSAKLQVKLPARLSEKDLEVLNRVAHRCYVGLSIEKGTEIEIDVAISGA